VKWRISFRPRAEVDLREVRRWYESKRIGLGAEWLEEVRRAIKVLEERPQSCGDYYRGFRRLLMHRFPYKLFYRIEGNTVLIFRILHAARDHRPRLND
jgi:toxin ParE1/3/4